MKSMRLQPARHGGGRVEATAGRENSPCSCEWIVNFDPALSVELRSRLPLGLLQLAVDAKLNAADGEQADFGFRLAALDLVGHAMRQVVIQKFDAPLIGGLCARLKSARAR